MGGANLKNARGESEGGVGRDDQKKWGEPENVRTTWKREHVLSAGKRGVRLEYHDLFHELGIQEPVKKGGG